MAVAAQVTAGLVAMAGGPMWTVAEADVLAGLDALMEGEARLAGVRARLIGEVQSRGLRTATGCTGSAALLRERYRIGPRAARRLGDQAEAVQVTFPAVGQAMADPIMHPGQTEAIVTRTGQAAATTRSRNSDGTTASPCDTDSATQRPLTRCAAEEQWLVAATMPRRTR